MPIGYRNLTTQQRGAFIIPNSTASGAIRGGAAVSVVDMGGNVKIIECSAVSNAKTFVGFAVTTVADGDVVAVISLRGSTVTPIVQGAGALTAGDIVYLSPTAGEITHTPVTTGTLIRVGPAISAAQITLLTDYQVQMTA